MPPSLRNVWQTRDIGVERARGYIVQQRLPHVRQCSVDQSNIGLVFADFVAEARRQFKTAGTTADNYYPMSRRHVWIAIVCLSVLRQIKACAGA